jgi:hypothetical protein
VISRRGLLAGVGGLFLGRGFMPEQLVPDSMAATIADMQRRLQVLEATSRVGFNRTRNAYALYTGTVATTFGVYEYGPAGSTYVDDTNTIAAGYPQLTMRTGTLVKVDFAAQIEGLATAASFRSNHVRFGISLDGAEPDFPGTSTECFNAAALQVDTTQSYTCVYRLAPGVHTFRFGCRWDDVNPAGSAPRCSAASLVVSPISPV